MTRPGGRIGLANWTPDSFVGRLFETIGRHVPPPPLLPSPSAWGIRERLDELFGASSRSIEIRPRCFVFRDHSPAVWIERFRRERRDGAPLEEELFALVAAGLRALEPCRAWIGEVLEGAQSPLRWATQGDAGPEEAFRVSQLDEVVALLGEHDLARAVGPVSLHLYWTLYLGALAYWAHDESPHREDTLALLDRSLQLFARSLREEPED